jgi:hypothetical protein
MPVAQHLIPFLGRGYSGALKQNLLWQDGSIYLMDNHRAALWCWQNELDLSQTSHSILHIDRHYDTLDSNLERHVAKMPCLQGLPIQQYLDASILIGGNSFPLFRWDNYLSMHIEKFGHNIQKLIWLTHRDGDKPKMLGWEFAAHDAPGNLAHWVSEGGPWIVNIDLDYFFCDSEHEKEYLQMYSDAYFDAMFHQLRLALSNGNIAAVTVCLTPTDFTAGWEKCLQLSRRAFQILGANHPTI